MLSDTQLISLPKVELHCHLLGVISPDLLLQMDHSGKPGLVDFDSLKQELPIRDTASFQSVIKLLTPYQQAQWTQYQPILSHHIQELIRQNVVYTEIMISPLMFPEGTSGLICAFSEFRQWVNVLEENRIQVEFLLVMPRWLEAAKIRQNTQDYIELFRAGLIAGVAIVGLEDSSSLQRFSRDLEKCKQEGLGIEIHAGEHSGPENVRDALDYGFPDRIGHGIGLFQDPYLIEHILNTEIHLEFCLSSNLHTGSVSRLEHHPLVTARQLGVSYSINTDDPGLFGCSLTNEYQLLTQYFNFDMQDFRQLFRYSIQARFQPKLKYFHLNQI